MISDSKQTKTYVGMRNSAFNYVPSIAVLKAIPVVPTNVKWNAFLIKLEQHSIQMLHIQIKNKINEVITIYKNYIILIYLSDY
jgi:hypothetical protein